MGTTIRTLALGACAAAAAAACSPAPSRNDATAPLGTEVLVTTADSVLHWARATPLLADSLPLDGTPVPWSQVSAYLEGLRFADRTELFPAYDVQEDELCDTCSAHVKLMIGPERGARNLDTASFHAGQRIVARIAFDTVPPDGSRSDFFAALGMTPANHARTSYLLASGHTGRILFDSVAVQGGQAVHLVATRKWTFDAHMDGHVLGFPMARWRTSAVRAAGDSSLSILTHLTGTWIACAEGCCTGTADTGH
ncbi:MAG: hypothetical protein JWM27_982 [Gemmatimonadetes bacterium]|nr:hypothetical protein [Gemmatimonadota bacterium]